MDILAKCLAAIYKWRLYFHFLAAQIQIITQKLYQLQQPLTNGTGLSLANSYILNYLISSNLWVTTRLWLTDKVLASFFNAWCLPNPTFFLLTFSLASFLPSYILLFHRPKQFFINQWQ